MISVAVAQLLVVRRHYTFMTIALFLRHAELVVTVCTNLAVIIASIIAYRRTKLLAFAIIILAGILTLTLSTIAHIHYAQPTMSRDDERVFYEFYRVGYIIISLIAVTGSLMLIRQFLILFARKDDHVA